MLKIWFKENLKMFKIIREKDPDQKIGNIISQNKNYFFGKYIMSNIFREYLIIDMFRV